MTYVSYDATEDIESKENILKCDWRELIYEMAYDYEKHNKDVDFYQQIFRCNPTYMDGITGYEQYYIELLGFWRTLYNPYDTLNCFSKTEGPTRAYWNCNAYLHPETMLFWFDFLDTGDTEISKYSVKHIGIRQKVTDNSKGQTTIFQTATPEVLFIKPDTHVEDRQGYNVLQLPASLEQLISTASQSRSLVEQINDLFYTHAYCTESITLTSIPLFWLEPNTQIRVKDIGDLVVSKIGCNLAHNGNMTITCTKLITPISY